MNTVESESQLIPIVAMRYHLNQQPELTFSKIT